MKKHAAALLSVFLVCGCSNITPNNEGNPQLDRVD